MSSHGNFRKLLPNKKRKINEQQHFQPSFQTNTNPFQSTLCISPSSSSSFLYNPYYNINANSVSNNRHVHHNYNKTDAHSTVCVGAGLQQQKPAEKIKFEVQSLIEGSVRSYERQMYELVSYLSGEVRRLKQQIDRVSQSNNQLQGVVRHLETKKDELNAEDAKNVEKIKHLEAQMAHFPRDLFYSTSDQFSDNQNQ